DLRHLQLAIVGLDFRADGRRLPALLAKLVAARLRDEEQVLPVCHGAQLYPPRPARCVAACPESLARADIRRQAAADGGPSVLSLLERQLAVECPRALRELVETPPDRKRVV